VYIDGYGTVICRDQDPGDASAVPARAVCSTAIKSAAANVTLLETRQLSVAVIGQVSAVAIPFFRTVN
jgi:hypothetical protein